MSRAALIITDADSISWDTYEDGHVYGVTTSADPSEQLLADLRTLTDAYTPRPAWGAAAARVRALLPKEDDDGA